MSTEEKLTNNGLREAFKASFSYKDINRSDINVLKRLLKNELSTFENSGFKMYLNKTVPYIHNVYKSGHLVSYSIRCTGIIQHKDQVPIIHFEDREAITFGADDFIGFCGWADNTNCKPFQNAFNSWLHYLYAEKDIDFEDLPKKTK